MIGRLDDLRARRLRYVTRAPGDLLRDVSAACASLGDIADRGVTDTDLPAIARTVEGIRRVLGQLRTGGNHDAA
ncbi:MAG: hypothetical protein GXC76_10635 [Rhodanobacteraceae bacterium]|jgi:hypothetical protein|nr:hypothetical protein [Rhodanobacteraceae bacterium]